MYNKLIIKYINQFNTWYIIKQTATNQTATTRQQLPDSNEPDSNNQTATNKTATNKTATNKTATTRQQRIDTRPRIIYPYCFMLM